MIPLMILIKVDGYIDKCIGTPTQICIYMHMCIHIHIIYICMYTENYALAVGSVLFAVDTAGIPWNHPGILGFGPTN